MTSPLCPPFWVSLTNLRPPPSCDISTHRLRCFTRLSIALFLCLHMPRLCDSIFQLVIDALHIRRPSIIVTLWPVLCISPLLLDPYLPFPSLCVRIIRCQACTVFLPTLSSLPYSPFHSVSLLPRPFIFHSAVETSPLSPPSPFQPFLISVLGFVWVESVSRGHCILYTCVYLRLCTPTL